MADVAIHLYAMTAVLSRATYSKNNGIKTADDEVIENVRVPQNASHVKSITLHFGLKWANLDIL